MPSKFWNSFLSTETVYISIPTKATWTAKTLTHASQEVCISTVQNILRRNTTDFSLTMQGNTDCKRLNPYQGLPIKSSYTPMPVIKLMASLP